jgi:Uma2 family endonuclease
MATVNSRKVNTGAKYSGLPLRGGRKMSISTFVKRYSEKEGIGKVELDEGTPYMMGGASMLHTLLAMEISYQFRRYLEGSPCKVYGADLYLRTGKESIREPDMTVICDHSKVNGKVYEGIPRLIVEVVSPSSKKFDLYDKKGEYYRLGVREYWIVVNKDEVRVNVWNEEEYIERIFTSKDGILKVPVQLEDWDLVVEIEENNIPKEILE